MDKATTLQRLKSLRQAKRRQERLVSAAVKSARMAGATWQEIGDSLGVTKQAVWKSYAAEQPYGLRLGPDS